jgi:uncharacterized protein YecT (DUF1311 family)
MTKFLAGSVATVLCMMSSSAMAASFDCGKVSKPLETLICLDSEVSALDSSLGEMYRNAFRSVAIENQSRLRDEQRSWLQERNKACALNSGDVTNPPVRTTKVSCLRKMYQARLETLAEYVPAQQTAKNKSEPSISEPPSVQTKPPQSLAAIPVSRSVSPPAPLEISSPSERLIGRWGFDYGVSVTDCPTTIQEYQKSMGQVQRINGPGYSPIDVQLVDINANRVTESWKNRIGPGQVSQSVRFINDNTYTIDGHYTNGVAEKTNRTTWKRCVQQGAKWVFVDNQDGSKSGDDKTSLASKTSPIPSELIGKWVDIDNNGRKKGNCTTDYREIKYTETLLYKDGSLLAGLPYSFRNLRNYRDPDNGEDYIDVELHDKNGDHAFTFIVLKKNPSAVIFKMLKLNLGGGKSASLLLDKCQ